MKASQGPPLSRRTFLGALAAAPLAAAGSRGQGVPRRPRIAVVGAGAFGGWTALHLLRRGAEVTLLDAWGPGNSRASSGGESRVIRAVYGADRIYVAMVRRAFELWAELEAASGEEIYRETGSLWMFRGDDSYLQGSLPVLAAEGFAVEEISARERGRRYPQIDFSGIRTTFLERRAGVLSARLACQAVARLFAEEGGTLRQARAEPGEIRGGRLTSLQLAGGDRLEADAYVFACGPWLGQLFPQVIGPAIRPTRQEVYYFGTPAGSDAFGPNAMPVWIDFGERILYGLPDVHGRGFKVADDTRGEEVDPTGLDRSPSPEGIAAARRFLAERFPALAQAPLLEARVCQYENSPDGDLIADRHPEAGNLWLAGGGSGHGFKLGPAVGELVARQVLDAHPGEPRFHLSRLGSLKGTGTQFQRQQSERQQGEGQPRR